MKIYKKLFLSNFYNKVDWIIYFLYMISTIFNKILRYMMISFVIYLAMKTDAWSSFFLAVLAIGSLLLIQQILNFLVEKKREYTYWKKTRIEFLINVEKKRASIPLNKLDDEQYNLRYQKIKNFVNQKNELKNEIFFTYEFLPNIIILIIYFILMTNYIWVIILTILFVCMGVLLKNKLNKKINKTREKIAPNDFYKYYIGDTLFNYEYLTEIKQHNYTLEMLEKLKKIYKENNALNRKVKKYEANITFLIVAIKYIFIIMCLSYLIYKMDVDKFNMIEFTFYAGIFTGFYDVFNEIVQKYLDYKRDEVIMKEYYDYIDEEFDDGEILLSEEIKTIEYKDVTFGYSGEKNKILKNFSYKFEVNNSYAIVGKNGCGKTTLIKLLLKVYDTYEGEILINGIELRNLKTENYLEMLSVVMQKVNIFAFNYKENISLKNNVFDDEIYKTKCNFFEINKVFEGNMKQKLTTHIDNGINLSGGQKQQLAIYRAFYSDKSVMIFDEPTSELDAFAEVEYYQKIIDNTKGKILLFTTHRMVACRYADKILVIDDGMVFEEGTHEELIKVKGKYKMFYGVQNKEWEENE